MSKYIDAIDVDPKDPRIKEVAEILLKAGERGVISAARAAIAWHHNQMVRHKKNNWIVSLWKKYVCPT